MPTLAELVGTQTDPTITQATANDPVVEPLDGPTTVDDVMDRFPEEVYQQGRDTHLYRFLTALTGDAGAGLLKAQTFAARLTFEAEFLNFQVLDEFYAAQFKFKRLLQETYPGFNPDTDALTPTQWDAIQLADQQYRQRMLDFFTATRYGNSPAGLALAGQAGCGVECDIVENYKWVYDQFSDDPLGILPEGTTASTGEFIVVPRFIGDEIESPFLEYQQHIERVYTAHAGSFDDSIRPSTGGTAPTVTSAFGPFDPDGVTKMVPAVERNVIDLLDRLRPATTLATVKPEPMRFTAIGVNGDVHASSERVHTSRLVTGNSDVPWPDTDPAQNYFIQAGVETEAGTFFGSGRELPVVFLTAENVHAYTDAARGDALYGTNEFYDESNGISNYQHYRSEQVGTFSPILQAIFPFLVNLSPDATFVAQNVIAINDTPLILEGRAV